MPGRLVMAIEDDVEVKIGATKVVWQGAGAEDAAIKTPKRSDP
jgi:hypothetical protein